MTAASGSLTARFDQGDGTDLRHLASDGEEIAARVYFAIRDAHWRTAPLTVVSREVVETPTGFEVTIEGYSAWPEMPMTFSISYRASGDTLVASFESTAQAAFRYCRIGFCVLHPAAESVGQPLDVRAADGTVKHESFPHDVEPQFYIDDLPYSMFGAFTGLTAGLPSGRTLDIAFEGDEFEVEDQRNWSDASFKTYCTPLTLGFPFDGSAGQRFAQSVTFTLSGEATADVRGAGSAISVGDVVGVLPDIRLHVQDDSPSTWRPSKGFPDLNRTRPDVSTLGDVDTLAFGINSSVHADDSWSILESTGSHGTIVGQVRSLYPTLALHVGPLDFQSPAGNWMTEDGTYVDPPPAPSTDPRRRQPIAAAYVLGSIASLVGTDPVSVGYFDPSIADSPAGRLVGWLSGRAGRDVHAVTTPRGISVVAIGDGPDVELVVANLASEPRTVTLPDGSPMKLGPDEVAMLSVRALPDAASASV